MTAGAAAPMVGNFTPRQISGTKLWLRGDLGITLTSSKVSTWANQGETGSTHNFTQGTAGNRPVVSAAALNGKDGIDFDGTDDFMTSTGALSGIIANNAYTCYVVAYADTLAAAAIAGTRYDITGAFLIDSGGSFVSTACNDDPAATTYGIGMNYDNNEDDAKSTPFSTGAGHLLMTQHSGGNVKSQIDNATIVSTASGNTGTLTGTMLIGCDLTHTLKFLDGRIFEIICVNRVVTSAENTMIRAYLKVRYPSVA